MTFNIFTAEHKHKLTRGERAEWTQYLWTLLNASAMTASARLARHIEFRVCRNGVWNLRSAFFFFSPPRAAPPPSFLSFGEWHIRLTDVTLLRRSLNCLSKGWDVGPRFVGLVGIGGKKGKVVAAHQNRTCREDFHFFFFLPILPPKTWFISLRLIGILITLAGAQEKPERACVFSCM